MIHHYVQFKDYIKTALFQKYIKPSEQHHAKPSIQETYPKAENHLHEFHIHPENIPL